MNELIAPQAVREEKDILAICLTGPRNSILLAVKLGLVPEHFYQQRHGDIFRGMMEVGLQKKPIDSMTVAAHMEGEGVSFNDLNKIIMDSPSAGTNLEARVERVIQMAERRNQWEAARRILSATDAGDEEEIAQGLSQIQSSVRLETQSHDRIAVARDFASHLRSNDPTETFRLPWKDLEFYSPGGFLRNHFVSVVGWSGHGKSVMLDQMLTGFSEQGYRVGVYMTEMDKRERIARYVAAGTGLSSSSLLLKTGLNDIDRERAAKWIEANPPPYDPIDAEGWSAMRIRQHAIINNYDCIAVDTVNNIPHRDRASFEDEIRTLVSAAKIAGCLTIGVFQLNQQRRDGISDPPPSLRDIRETGQVEHLSDRVMALHFENENGEQFPNGTIRFLKCRGGRQGGKVEISREHSPFVFEDSRLTELRKRQSADIRLAG